jgi:hypothetical protein
MKLRTVLRNIRKNAGLEKPRKPLDVVPSRLRDLFVRGFTLSRAGNSPNIAARSAHIGNATARDVERFKRASKFNTYGQG